MPSQSPERKRVGQRRPLQARANASGIQHKMSLKEKRIPDK